MAVIPAVAPERESQLTSPPGRINDCPGRKPLTQYVHGAQVAELVDAQVSGTCGRKVVEVRVFSWAPFFRAFGQAKPGWKLINGGNVR